MLSSSTILSAFRFPDYFLQEGEAYRMVCYYENWSQYREGVQKMMPFDIDPSLCTHIMYSFAAVENGEIAPTEDNDFGKLQHQEF